MPGRLDPEPRLRTGVWITNRGYVQAFGFPTAATHGCLESQPRLHTGVWSPKRAIVQVAIGAEVARARFAMPKGQKIT